LTELSAILPPHGSAAAVQAIEEDGEAGGGRGQGPSDAADDTFQATFPRATYLYELIESEKTWDTAVFGSHRRQVSIPQGGNPEMSAVALASWDGETPPVWIAVQI
jgi:hypothetical protein